MVKDFVTLALEFFDDNGSKWNVIQGVLLLQMPLEQMPLYSMKLEQMSFQQMLDQM
jgi:hypothetical protein